MIDHYGRDFSGQSPFHRPEVGGDVCRDQREVSKFRRYSAMLVLKLCFLPDKPAGEREWSKRQTF